MTITIPLHGPVTRTPYKGDRLLRNAILVVHFSPVLRINEPGGAGIVAFQEAIRSDYPQLSEEVEQVVSIEFKDGGPTPSLQAHPVWRFFDIGGLWRVSLTRQSIGIETQVGYVNRFDFAARMRKLVEAVEQDFRPGVVNRVGTRYVNVREIGDQMMQGCAPQLVSITGLPEIVQADLAWRLNVDEGLLLLRSGIVPQGATYDPAVLDPVGLRSWYLDIDVFQGSVAEFKSADIFDQVAAQVERAHAVYKWAMPEQGSVSDAIGE